MSIFGQRLKELRKARRLLQKELAAHLGVSRNTLASWEAGHRTPEISAAQKLADYFGVSLDYLLGRSDVSTMAAESRPGYPASEAAGSEHLRVPLIASLRESESLFSARNIEGYLALSGPLEKGSEHFFWRVKGDTMVGARICAGDLVLVRRQSDVEDGDIAVVLVNGEPTLQRVYRADGKRLLQPENPAMRPLLAAEDEIEIIGKVIHVQFDVEQRLPRS